MAKGEHRKDKYRIQAYYFSRDKALQVMVAKHDKKTLTDSILDNAIDRAKTLGILDKEGKVTDAFKDELELEISLVEQQ